MEILRSILFGQSVLLFQVWHISTVFMDAETGVFGRVFSRQHQWGVAVVERETVFLVNFLPGLEKFERVLRLFIIEIRVFFLN